jgi:hypothetical protein
VIVVLVVEALMAVVLQPVLPLVLTQVLLTAACLIAVVGVVEMLVVALLVAALRVVVVLPVILLVAAWALVALVAVYNINI